MRKTAARPAGNSTWAAQPASADWNTPANWTSAVVPTDTATFRASAQPGIRFAPDSIATVHRIVFTGDASAYSFLLNAPASSSSSSSSSRPSPNATLTIAGAISNESAFPQSFAVVSSARTFSQPQLQFIHNARAGGSNMSYAVGPSAPADYGGGVVGFYDTASAESASFTVTTGAGTSGTGVPGGEVSFNNRSSAGTARFTVYGTTGTTYCADYGYTFGNVVFHNSASAASAVFTNVGGTVSVTSNGQVYGGDGGNTQFYDTATAESGLFHNMGATCSAANGGDVAFDGTSTAANGNFHNHAATVAGGHGGVTSFNNNSPAQSAQQGASAGNGVFHNYGAKASGQGGGHTFFTALQGSPTAANGTFFNHGSAVAGSESSAGHTVLSITVPQTVAYRSDAGSGVFWNLPGTADGAPGGYTELTVYPAKKGDPIRGSLGPTAGTATFINLGAVTGGARGGRTSFSGTSSAQKARLLALGGVDGGYGGMITFSDYAYGEEASVVLRGNGTLSIGDYYEDCLMIGDLELAPGNVEITLGKSTPYIKISGTLKISDGPASFQFTSGSGLKPNKPYTLLSAPNLSAFSPSQFKGNTLDVGSPAFCIVDDELQVSFITGKAAGSGKKAAGSGKKAAGSGKKTAGSGQVTPHKASPPRRARTAEAKRVK